MAVELSPIIENARDHLAHSVRELWHFGACHDALERAATHFSSERPWIEGWIGFRTALRFEGDAMPDEVRARLTALIDGLKPTDLLHKARAVVLGRSSFGWDVADGDADDGDVMKPYERASQLAKEIGTALAHDPESPPDALGPLLTDIANLADGVEIALDILHMHFYRDREEGRQRAPCAWSGPH